MATIALWLATAITLVGVDGPEAGRPAIGDAITGFALTDDRGEVRRLEEWRGSRTLVVVFLRAECPVAELYATPLAEMAHRFEVRGVTFVGVVPGRSDPPSTLARFAKAHGIGFPLLRDPECEVVARLGATRTPEVVVLDDARILRYRGRIDDQYAVGSRRATAGRHDLRDALDAILAGRPVAEPETQAVGCPIAQAARTASTADVTYSRDVAPILQKRCVACHRPGQVGPFSLTNYRQASAWAEAIAEVVDDGRMPPWHADPKYGRFANDARLTDLERRQLTEWANAGAPEGDRADLPTLKVPTGDWQIRQPDMVVSMPRPFHVPAEGVVDYQSFEVDPGFAEDRWIQSAEIRPGNRKVVHHCNVFLKAPGSRDEPDAQGELGSYCLAATTPGSPPMSLSPGMAKRIPAGWKLVFVLHYTPVGTPQDDRTSLGLVFADPRSVKKEVATNLMYDPALRIPPRVADYRVEHTRRFDDDVLLLSLFPHMHLRGKSFRYEAIAPDGAVEVLLDVPRYDFNWQNRYELAEPKRLPAGTTLRCIAHFDNSAGNPANPDPDAVVLAGKQSWEEMFNGYYDIALADQDLTRPPTRAEVLRRAALAYAQPSLSLAGLACAGSLLVLRRNRLRREAGGNPPRGNP